MAKKQNGKVHQSGRSAPVENVGRMALSELVPYARNPKTHPQEQVDLLARSMERFKQTSFVLVDEAGEIIAGHGRVLAAEKLGWEDIAVVRALGWTDEEKRAYRIADNELGSERLAPYDMPLLKIEMQSLKGFDIDLSLTGFGIQEIKHLTADPMADDADSEKIPPVPDVATSRLGDLWLMGDHRLLCGSSVSEEDVVRLMDGARAQLFSTDPPYAVGYKGGQHPEARGSENPKRNKNWEKVYNEADAQGAGKDGYDFYDAFIKVAIKQAIEPHAAWYCWHSSIRASMVERVWDANGAFTHQQIIWVKSRAVLTYSVYLWQHEPCYMGWIRGKKPHLIQTQVAKRSGLSDFNTSVWSVPNSEIESDKHPTSKPTKLFEIPMLVHTKPGALCYEPFSGSGSQIIAAAKQDRRCFAMEVSPLFVDVAVERWQQFSGKKAVLDRDGRTFEQIKKERGDVNKPISGKQPRGKTRKT